MVNKNHKDFIKYESECKKLLDERDKEWKSIKLPKVKGYDSDCLKFERKYMKKLKELQEKYHYLFD